MTPSTTPQPVFYIPHGGGPCFFMDWTLGPANTWDRMADWLRGLSATLPRRPDAVLVISAHWEAAGPRITAGAAPELIYDYYGFPPHTYEITYPAAGAPALAARARDLLEGAGFTPHLDTARGFDHGIFIPFKLIYPDADIPIVQVSMDPGLDPSLHHQIGRALAPLRDENVLIVGSGLSSHNLGAMMRNTELEGSAAFNQWLEKVSALPADERAAALGGWEAAPMARHVHPREEHLLPLMVAAGAAGEDPGHCVYRDVVLGAVALGIRFDRPEREDAIQ